VHQINLRTTRHLAKRQNQDRPIFFLPMRRPPKLHNLPVSRNQQVLSLQHPIKCPEASADLAADTRSHACRFRMFPGIEIHLEKRVRRCAESHRQLNNRRHGASLA
jgi:hypothetical protein